MSKERLQSPRARLFVALELPEQLLDRLIAWQEETFSGRRELRMPSRYSLHVTLVFLGYQYERDVDRIAETSFSEGGGPFELRVEEVLEVPPRRPRLYAVGLEDTGDQLTQWQRGLAERLQHAGVYEPEKRPFWPHVTVARFKQTERHRTGAGARSGSRRQARSPAESRAPVSELPDEMREPFKADRLTLYKSTLRPQGAIYEALKKLELGT